MIRITDIQEIAAPRGPTAEQRLAVAGLTAACDAITSRGLLSESVEALLRKLTVETQNAFGMPTKAERTVRVGDHTPEPVR